jgi:hypothetical protein
MADRMLDGRPLEDVVAVRLASEALRHLATDEARFAAFQAWLLRTGGEMPLGVSRAVTEQLTPDLLSAAREIYLAAMIRGGYQWHGSGIGSGGDGARRRDQAAGLCGQASSDCG